MIKRRAGRGADAVDVLPHVPGVGGSRPLPQNDPEDDGQPGGRSPGTKLPQQLTKTAAWAAFRGEEESRAPG